MSSVMLDTKDIVVKKIPLVPGPDRTYSQMRDSFFFFLITNNHIITIQTNWRYKGEDQNADVASNLRPKRFQS